MVRLPTAAEHIRLAPVRVLRAVFSGVGQLLLAGDRLRAVDSARESAERGNRQKPQPEPLEAWEGGLSSSVRLTARPAKPNESGVAPARSAKPSHDAKHAKSGAGRTSAKSSRISARTPSHAAAGASRRTPGRTKKPADLSPFRSLDLTGNVRMLSERDIADIQEDSQARSAEPAPLPIAGYDGLSLASIRARLRYLDADQLRRLVDYERSNARRGDVVTMLERRIDKLTGPTGYQDTDGS
jgi:hypothetical protein